MVIVRTHSYRSCTFHLTEMTPGTRIFPVLLRVLSISRFCSCSGAPLDCHSGTLSPVSSFFLTIIQRYPSEKLARLQTNPQNLGISHCSSPCRLCDLSSASDGSSSRTDAPLPLGSTWGAQRGCICIVNNTKASSHSRVVTSPSPCSCSRPD